MKHLNSYNESIRDKMTPKSEVDIRNTIERLALYPDEELVFGVENNIDWVVKEAIEEGANVNLDIRIGGGVMGQMFRSLLQYACYKGFTEIVKLLLDAGADKELDDNLAMRAAVAHGHNEIIKILKIDKNINEGIRDKMTPKSKDEIRDELNKYGKRDPDSKLVKGAMEGLIWLVEEAIAEGGNIHVQGDIALREAALNGHLEMVKFLLSKGADVKPYDYEAERWAKMKKHTEVAKVLMSARLKRAYKDMGRLKESVRDLMTPKSEEEILKVKEELISYITKMVESMGGSITMGEIEADTSPVIETEPGEGLQQIEALYDDHVEVVIYGGYKGEEETDSYNVDYIKLDNDVLLQIKDVLDTAIEYGFLEVMEEDEMNESIRDLMTPKPMDDVWDAITRMTLLEKIKWMIHNSGSNDLFEYKDLMGEFERCTLPEKKSIIEYAIKSNILRRPAHVDLVTIRELPIVFKEILKYFFYMGEGVSDKMTPKSREEIKKHMSRFDPETKMISGCNNDMLWLVKQAIEEEGAYVHFMGDLAYRYALMHKNKEIMDYLISKGVDKEKVENSMFRLKGD